MSNQNLKPFRTLTGPARKSAMRAHLANIEGIDFRADPHTLTFAQQCALSDMAKAVSWRKSITSPLSLGLAFFVYLARDVSQTGQDSRQCAEVSAPIVIHKTRRSFFLAGEVQS